MTYEAITPVSPVPARLAAYAGRYDSEELEVTYDLAVESGRLVLRSPRRPKLTLGPTVSDVFEAGGVILKFERGAGRSVTGFDLGAGRIRNVRFVRRTR